MAERIYVGRRRSRDGTHSSHGDPSSQGDSSSCTGCSRRRFLVGTVMATATGLAGCFSDDEDDLESVEPIDLTGGRECAVCGMIIEEHYGPAGQIFYAGGHPEGGDGPVAFDSIPELLVYDEEQRAKGQEERVVFVTDYSSVDYELEGRDGTVHISTHADVDTFADATELYYAVDSDVHGAMGADFLPFSNRRDAQTLVEEHGGEVFEWDELSSSSVEML